MYTIEIGLAACAVALLSLLCVPFYSHLRSAIVHSARPTLENTIGGVAKRMVVVVSDGLSHDADMSLLDALVKEKKGRRLTSWVDPPTESRPAHAQLLCGVGEDATSLFTGWKRFPVRPDSVLNRAPFSVAIGAPDVVPFFTGPNVYMETFSQAMYQQDGVHLDEWTRSKLSDLLKHGQENEQMGNRLKTIGTVFFLHLAGVDTTGHRFGSQSEQYREAAKSVQRVVQDITKSIDDFYKDDDTAFMVLSDHGFGRGRSHDEGSEECRKTPLFLWGKGFSGDVNATVRTVQHRDLSLLISAALGNQLPSDSTGLVPTDLLVSASDVFKASVILLACQNGLNRMRAIYNQQLESRRDRLLMMSSVARDIEAMSHSFDQLQIIVENKPTLAGDVIQLAKAAHVDILSKTDKLVWRNSSLAIIIASIGLLLATVALHSVGYCNGKGSGDSGVYSYVALLAAMVTSFGLLLRGAELPYFVWCWATALVFAVNGPVVSPTIVSSVDPIAFCFLIVTVLAVFVPELIVFGLASFVILTIITAKKEGKRSLYGLVALLASLLVPVSHHVRSIQTDSAICLGIKAAAMVASAVLGRQKGGELMIAQVMLCLGGLVAAFLNLSSFVRVILVLSLPAYFMNTKDGSEEMRFFWLTASFVVSLGHTADLFTFLFLSLASFLVIRVYRKESLGDLKYDRFVPAMAAMLAMAGIVCSGGIEGFEVDTSYSRHLYKDSKGVSVVVRAVLLALPLQSLLRSVKTGAHKDETVWRMTAGMMLPFSAAGLLALLTIPVVDSTWRAVSMGLGRFAFCISACSVLFLTGYL